MTYKCSVCGKEFEDGDEYANHVPEHNCEDIGIHVVEELELSDRFGKE